MFQILLQGDLRGLTNASSSGKKQLGDVVHHTKVQKTKWTYVTYTHPIIGHTPFRILLYCNHHG